MVDTNPPNLRQIALKHARPESFEDGPNYDPQAGHPVGAGMPSGSYKEEPPKIDPSGAKAIDTPKPFTIGGK